MRIVFMGTPEFSVPSLQVLAGSGHQVVGVFTQPDRLKGRGNKLAQSPVKTEALRLGIPVFQPEKNFRLNDRIKPLTLIFIGKDLFRNCVSVRQPVIFKNRPAPAGCQQFHKG